MRPRGQRPGDYHDRAVVAGHRLKPAFPRDPDRAAVCRLDHAVHSVQAGGHGNVEQRPQHALPDPLAAVPRQHHQGEFRRAVLCNVFGLADHVAVRGERQHGDTLAMIDQTHAFQQGLIRCVAVGEVALVETRAIHAREEALDLTAIAGNRRPDTELAAHRRHRLAGAHDTAPLMKSTVASMTSRSSSTRR